MARVLGTGRANELIAAVYKLDDFGPVPAAAALAGLANAALKARFTDFEFGERSRGAGQCADIPARFIRNYGARCPTLQVVESRNSCKFEIRLNLESDPI